jgi:hypothetical protein
MSKDVNIPKTHVRRLAQTGTGTGHMQISKAVVIAMMATLVDGMARDYHHWTLA